MNSEYWIETKLQESGCVQLFGIKL
jgi:hypothetical protein